MEDDIPLRHLAAGEVTYREIACEEGWATSPDLESVRNTLLKCVRCRVGKSGANVVTETFRLRNTLRLRTCCFVPCSERVCSGEVKAFM